MSYLPKLAPVVGNGLGGLPERKAGTGIQSALAVGQKSISVANATTAGQLIYEEVATGAYSSVNPSVAPSGPALSALSGPVTKAAQQTVATGVTATHTDVSISPVNGDIVTVFRNSTTSVNIKRYNSDMVQQGAEIIVIGNFGTPRVCHAPDGRFAVSLSGTAPTARIYNADGSFAIAVGPSAVTVSGCDATFLQNGDIALAWYVPSLGEIRLGIYTPAGATVVTLVVLTKPTGGVLPLRLCTGSDGNFLIYSEDTNVYRTAVYTPSGALVGTVKTEAAASLAESSSVTPLPAGGFACVQVVLSSYDTITFIRWLNNEGVTTSSTSVSLNLGNYVGVAAVSNGDVVLSVGASTYIYSALQALKSGPLTLGTTGFTYNAVAANQTSNDFAIFGVATNLPYVGTYQQYATGSYRLAGIAMTAAAAGATINMQTSGLYAGALTVPQFAANYRNVGGKVISIANNQALIG
jgi:hypothetical protein